MRQIKPQLFNGLNFNQRNSEPELMFNVSLRAKENVLSARRNHLTRFTVADPAYRILYSPVHSVEFWLGISGTLRSNTTTLDTGYDTQFGSLVLTPPSNLHAVPHLFIAANKMTKYNGVNMSKWGIDAPIAAALTPTLTGVTEVTLNACDAASEWTSTGSGFSDADETTIKQQGSGSLAITIPATTDGSETRVFGAPVNFGGSEDDLICLWMRFTDPQAITKLSIQFALGASDFSGNIATREIGFDFAPTGAASSDEMLVGVQNAPIEGGDSELYKAYNTSLAPISPNAWGDVRLKRSSFRVSGGDFSAVTAMRLNFHSATAQTAYVDFIRIRRIGQDDAVGRRYKYRYINTGTGHVSNLNTTPSVAFKGQSGLVNVAGATASTDPQVNGIQFFGDTGGDGVYRFLGTKANDTAAFEDTVQVKNLGIVDTNDNLPPPNASLAVYFANRMWVNDLSNRNRIWASVPGRLESFNTFFVVGETDTIRGMFVLGTQLYVMTVNRLIRVFNPESDTPQFRPIADVGTINEAMYAVSSSKMVSIHFSGLYLFDGSIVTPLKSITTLFDLNSIDPRRINLTNLFTARVGSDDNNVWLSYTQLNSISVTYAFNVQQNSWVQESDVITAHDSGHQTYHIAALSSGTHVDMYQGSGFADFNYTSDEIDTTTIGKTLTSTPIDMSRVVGLGIEYVCSSSILASAWVEGTQRKFQLLPTAPTRSWVFIPLDDNEVGQRMFFKLVAVSPDLIEIYSAEWWLAEMTEDIVKFDSGEVFLSSELCTPCDINIHLFAHENLTYDATWWTDGTSQLIVDNQIVTAGPHYSRQFLFPYVGRNGRLVILASKRFSPIAFTVGTIGFGDGAVKQVKIDTKST